MIEVNKKYGTILGAVGNVLVWYNFGLLMPFLVVISKNFFSMGDQYFNSVVSLLAVSVGLFFRPVGSAIFGPMGDKVGRQLALSLSILLMAVPTICMGLLPNSSQWGIYAPITFIFLRCLQGISMGGEYTAAMVHLVELAPQNRRGFYGCFSDAGCQIGVLLAGQALVILYLFFTEEEIYSFAWRYPFLLAILLVPFAFISIQKENTIQKDTSNQEPTPSMIDSLIKYKKEVTCTIAITSFSAIGFYTLLTFLPYYFVREGFLTLQEATKCSMYANLVITAVIFCCGYLSDIFKRKPFLIAGMIGVPLSVYYMFLSNGKSFTFLMIMNVVYGVFLGMYYSCRAAFFSEAFPKHVRCTAVSLSLSLAQAIFGGSSTLIMNYLTAISEKLAILPITVVAVGGIVAVLVMQDRTGKKLID
ncbi:MFS transporter [Alphaproteobacteria bacterium]|nr:MFS transporter [Alphaproteobacteria bacterium]